MHYQIEYGHNRKQGCVIQINYNAIKRISFLNWERSSAVDELYVVAIWRVKRLKTKAIIDLPPFLIEQN